MRVRPLEARLNQNAVFFALILLIGIFSRSWEFGALPPGLNQDEASIGVEAYDLAHFGIDRNGNSFPVNLVSWGSGQNVLYAYLLIPFVFFNLTSFTVRLPMLITGILSLPLIYFVAGKVVNRKIGLIAMFLIAISPWHIILSRWGLESNLLPFIFLVGFACLVKAAPGNRWVVAAGLFFALCLYAYGTAYLAVPLFLILAIPFLVVYKRVNLRDMVVALLVFSILAVPIYLFVVINSIGHGTIHLGPITIPRLPAQARFESVSAIFSGHPLAAFEQNIRVMLTLLWKQSDGLIWNSLEPYGYFYKVTFPLAILGVLMLIPFRRSVQVPERWLLLAWLAASLAIGVIQPVNINRINLIFIPLLICTAVFLEWLDKRVKALSLVALLCLSVSFGFFTRDYHGAEYRERAGAAFFAGLIPALDYARQAGDGPICVTDRVEMPYIYVLFSDHLDPRDYLQTIKYVDPQAPFRQVQSLGRYTFGLRNCASVPNGTLFVLSTREAPDQAARYQYQVFGDYSVYIPQQDGTK